jgi:uncharacterized membrane protein YgcG
MRQIQMIVSALGFLACVGSALGIEPAVRDAAGVFKPEAVQQAESIAAQIKRDSSKDVLVETFAAIPDSLQAKFKSMPKDRFYQEWAVSRAKAANLNGVYMLIVKNPGHLQVDVGRQTRQSAFRDADVNRLRDLMLGKLKQNDFDGALLEGVQLVQERVKTNTAGAPAGARPSGGTAAGPEATGSSPPVRSTPHTQRPTARPSDGSSMGGFVCLVGGLVGVFVIIAIVRSIAGGMRGGPSTGGPVMGGGYGGGGGGFGSGMLGGLLGGLMGGWLSDRWGDHGSSRSDSGPDDFSRGDTSSGGDFGSSQGPDQGSDFGSGGDYSTGGDFGGSGSSDNSWGNIESTDSGGGGFGDSGGDFGGGDFGGGDSSS